MSVGQQQHALRAQRRHVGGAGPVARPGGRVRPAQPVGQGRQQAGQPARDARANRAPAEGVTPIPHHD